MLINLLSAAMKSIFSYFPLVAERIASLDAPNPNLALHFCVLFSCFAA